MALLWCWKLHNTANYFNADNTLSCAHRMTNYVGKISFWKFYPLPQSVSVCRTDLMALGHAVLYQPKADVVTCAVSSLCAVNFYAAGDDCVCVQWHSATPRGRRTGRRTTPLKRAVYVAPPSALCWSCTTAGLAAKGSAPRARLTPGRSRLAAGTTQFASAHSATASRTPDTPRRLPFHVFPFTWSLFARFPRLLVVARLCWLPVVLWVET